MSRKLGMYQIDMRRSLSPDPYASTFDTHLHGCSYLIREESLQMLVEDEVRRIVAGRIINE